MTEPKWTKGPWVYGEDCFIEDENGRWLAEITSSNINDDEDEDSFWRACGEADCNGALIAAAPDLYVMVEKLVDVLEEVYETLPVKQEKREDILSSANKILAKARGEHD